MASYSVKEVKTQDLPRHQVGRGGTAFLSWPNGRVAGKFEDLMCPWVMIEYTR
jgi:hypothetical protein